MRVTSTSTSLPLLPTTTTTGGPACVRPLHRSIARAERYWIGRRREGGRREGGGGVTCGSGGGGGGGVSGVFSAVPVIDVFVARWSIFVSPSFFLSFSLTEPPSPSSSSSSSVSTPAAPKTVLTRNARCADPPPPVARSAVQVGLTQESTLKRLSQGISDFSPPPPLSNIQRFKVTDADGISLCLRLLLSSFLPSPSSLPRNDF